MSEEDLRVLRDCELKTSVKVNKCVKAANLLLNALSSNLPSGLTKMKAFDEQKMQLEDLKKRFCESSSSYIKNSITFLFNQHSSNLQNKLTDNSLVTLPPHKSIFDELIMFKELIPWLYNACIGLNSQQPNKFDEVKNVSYKLKVLEFKTIFLFFKAYIAAAKQSYTNEIIPFCSIARSSILKQEKTKQSNNLAHIEIMLLLSSN